METHRLNVIFPAVFLKTFSATKWRARCIFVTHVCRAVSCRNLRRLIICKLCKWCRDTSKDSCQYQCSSILRIATHHLSRSTTPTARESSTEQWHLEIHKIGYYHPHPVAMGMVFSLSKIRMTEKYQFSKFLPVRICKHTRQQEKLSGMSVRVFQYLRCQQCLQTVVNEIVLGYSKID